MAMRFIFKIWFLGKSWLRIFELKFIFFTKSQGFPESFIDFRAINSIDNSIDRQNIAKFYLSSTISLYLLILLRSSNLSSRSRSKRSPKVQFISNFLLNKFSWMRGLTVADIIRFLTFDFSGTQATKAKFLELILTSLKLYFFVIVIS